MAHYFDPKDTFIKLIIYERYKGSNKNIKNFVLMNKSSNSWGDMVLTTCHPKTGRIIFHLCLQTSSSAVSSWLIGPGSQRVLEPRDRDVLASSISLISVLCSIAHVVTYLMQKLLKFLHFSFYIHVAL